MFKLRSSFLPLTLALLVFISAWPGLAQKRPSAPRRAAPTQVPEPAPTFDTLLTEDSYRVYSEVRNVGQLVRSPGFSELLEPLIKLADPPKQFSSILKWITTNADPLAGSRLFIASWASKDKIPAGLLAIEFSSVEEAKKFESKLRVFLPKLDPKPAPSPSPAAQQLSPQLSSTPDVATTENKDTFASLQIKQMGSLILVTDKPIALSQLRPRGSRLLAEDPNFALARNRFASEPLFLYVDFRAIEKEEQEQRKKWQEEEKKREEKLAANPIPEPTIEPDVVPVEDSMPPTDFEAPPPPVPEDSPPQGPDGSQQPARSPSDSQRDPSMNSIMIPMSMALFGGRGEWPEAVGAALAFEEDSYIVRALVVNNPEKRSLPLPFFPRLASGPSLTPSSPNILPADVDLFVVLSLDYAQVYDGMVKAFTEQPMFYYPANLKDTSPFAGFEQKVGIKVKDDLLPLLGNEVALVLPKPGTAPTAVETSPPNTEDRRSVRLPELTPVIAVAVKDKEAVKRLIPRMIESLGLKGASMLAQTERREDTELISYANLFSYGFIGDFLLIAPDPALTRRTVDSYLSRQTLSSDSRFRNATRWQARQLQGQVYMAPDIVESYVFTGRDKTEYLSTQTNQPINPLTYSLSNEGLGPLHEVHIPRSLLMMVIHGFSSRANESPIFTNESIAKNVLRTVASAQATYKQTKGNGQFGSLDELIAAELLPRDLIEKYGYRIELSVVGNKFEAIAMPVEYEKTGRRSFYIDESGVLRGGDHAGGAATLSDKPVNE